MRLLFQRDSFLHLAMTIKDSTLIDDEHRGNEGSGESAF
jgi:hypothetical protein